MKQNPYDSLVNFINYHKIPPQEEQRLRDVIKNIVAHESPDSKEADYNDLHTVLWECGIGAQGTEAAIKELTSKFIITKKQ